MQSQPTLRFQLASRYGTMRRVALRCVASSTSSAAVSETVTSPVYVCRRSHRVCVCVKSTQCVVFSFCCLCCILQPRNEQAKWRRMPHWCCALSIARCLLPALFGNRHHRRLRVRISPLAFAICLRQNSRKSQQKDDKTGYTRRQMPKCWNAAMCATERANRCRCHCCCCRVEPEEPRLPSAVSRLPNTERGEKRAHVQHADRQTAVGEGLRGRGGGRQANFFGVNAFCTKTWFFGCQRCSWRRCRRREQRCFRYVGIAARCFFFVFFFVSTIVAISYALVTVTSLTA